MEKREYIEILKAYLKSYNVSIGDYYYTIAMMYRTKSTSTMPDFEKQNPFLSEKDLNSLLASEDMDIEEYFAYIMTNLIEAYQESDQNETNEEVGQEPIDLSADELEPILSREEIGTLVSEKLQALGTTVKITSISRKISDSLNGFAVVREEKIGRAHVYLHKAEDNSLKKHRVFYNNECDYESGYYVNFQEYMDRLVDEIVEKYPTVSEFHFVRDDGVIMTLDEIAEEAYSNSVKYGVFSVGDALNDDQEYTYQEYKELGIDTRKSSPGKTFKEGLYVRRDILMRIFDKFKIHATVVSDTDKKQSTK